MLYTIAIQNLRLQVSVPDSTDTAALDKVVREFNDHLMTFNGGRSVELFESKEVKLLIGMQKKQEQTHETAAALAKENEKVNIRDDQETLEKIKKLISLCDRGLTKHP